jgi:hypothetical protein
LNQFVPTANLSYQNITTTSAALAATKGIRESQNGANDVKSLQEYQKDTG